MNTNVRWISAAVIVVATVAAVWQCNRAGWLRKPTVIIPGKPDTVYLADTTDEQISFDKDTVYIPYTVVRQELVPTDTVAILKDYYEKYLLTDTVFKSKYGNLVLYDSITQNRIDRRRVVSTLHSLVQVVTKRITIRDTLVRQVTAPGRFVVYFGGAILGTPWSGQLDFGVRLKSDLYLGVTTEKRWKERTPTWGARILLPIKFYKR